jgi:hypothetical protein
MGLRLVSLTLRPLLVTAAREVKERISAHALTR